MIITDKKIAVENRLIPFIKRIIIRLTQKTPKLDYPLLIDGFEGYGKSNFSQTFGYIIAYFTKRKFTLDNIFFIPEEMINFALNSTDQIIIWDEAALAALAMQKSGDIQLLLIQMLSVARKNRHLFIINIPRFYRLKEPIIERCMGMVHVYARKQTKLGRFFFYKKESLDNLYEDYRRTRRRPKYSNWVTVRGEIGEYASKIIDQKEYDKKKDIGIQYLLKSGKTKVNPYKQELYDYRIRSSKLKFPIKNQEEYAKQMGIPRRTIFDGWKDLTQDQLTPLNPSLTQETALGTGQVIYNRVSNNLDGPQNDEVAVKEEKKESEPVITTSS